MTDEYFARAELVMTRIQRLQLEADQAVTEGDLDRVKQLQNEMAVLVESMFDIREEQLMAHLDKQARRRPWWRLHKNR